MNGKQKLKQFLVDNGMRNDHLAKKLNISIQRLWAILSTPNTKPSIELAVRIQEFTKGFVKCEDWVK